MNANFLEIDVKAKEKASHWADNQGINNDEYLKVSFYEKFFEFRQNCFTFKEPLAPGDYTIPFEFRLPDWAPGSCYWQRKGDYRRPKIKVRYSIMAKIHNHDKTFIRYKNLLMVHEPPVKFQQNTVG